MKNKLLSLTVSGACLAIALGTSWAGRRAARETAVSGAALVARSAAIDREVQEAKRRIAAAEQDGATVQRELADLQSRQDTAKLVSQRLKFSAILTSNPKVFRLWLNAFRADVAAQFRLFYRDLGLSPLQVEKFEAILTEHVEREIELKGSALALGLEASDPDIAALQQTEDARLQSEQTALLGDAAYKQLQQFNRQQPVRPIVDTVAFAVALTSTPLSGAQAGELTQILANAQRQYQNGGVAVPDATKIDWSTALAQAQLILSANQIEALNRVADQAHLSQLLAQFDSHNRQ